MKNRSEFTKEAVTKNATPYIPKGYEEVKTEGVGFVIQRKSDGSQLTWVPVSELEANGNVFEGAYNSMYNNQFGVRKTVQFDRYSVVEVPADLGEQLRSIQKYGGFYVSRYHISRSDTGKLQSVADQRPITNIDFCAARRIAEDFERNEELTTHLLMGCEYDTMWEWIWSTCLDKSALYALQEKYIERDIPSNRTPQITGTGYNLNNICDAISDTCEWTQECRRSDYLVTFRDCHRFSDTVYQKMMTPKRRFVFGDNKFDHVSIRVAVTFR